jgi:hypothetical protein
MVVSQEVAYVIADDMTRGLLKQTMSLRTQFSVCSPTLKGANLWRDTFIPKEARDFWFPRAIQIAEAIKMVSILGTAYTAPKKGGKDGISEGEFFRGIGGRKTLAIAKFYNLDEMLEILRGYQTEDTSK